MLSGDDALTEADLVFREQADGRKVSRLPNGKIVLIDLSEVDRVKDGERWKVSLVQKDTFAIAHCIDRLEANAAASFVQTPMNYAAARSAPRRNPTQIIMPASLQPKPLAAPPASVAPVVAPIATSVVTQATPATVLKEGDRVALFIDGANTDGASREAGYFVDFGKARKFFQGEGTAYAAFYFVADFTQKDELQVRFLDFLSHAGYVVRKKAVKKITDDETGEVSYKSNVDTEVVVELLNTQDNYDVAFLFSGDSDFERVVDILRSRGKRVYVVSSRANLSRELSYVADKPIFYLENFKSELQREDKSPVKATT
jgi:uncharacterized LabA/DUF88 family protein